MAPESSKGKEKMGASAESVRTASSRPAAVDTEIPIGQSGSRRRSDRSRLRATPISPTDTA